MIVFRVTGGAHFLRAMRSVPKWVRDTADEVAEEFVDLIDAGFDKGRDPYGKRWAPLVLRNGKPLINLKGTFSVSTRPSKAGGNIHFIIEGSREEAKYPQGGTGLWGPKKQRIYPRDAQALWIPGFGAFASVKGQPPRRMVPDRGLPANYRRKYEATFRRAFEEHFRE